MIVICGTDFSEPSARAVRVAAAMTRNVEDSLVLAHAVAPVIVADVSMVGVPWVDSMDTSAMDQLQASVNLLQAQGVRAQWRLVAHPAHVGILEQAKLDGASFVVAGTHGRGSAGRFLMGSVAERLIQDSPIPVLVVGSDADALAAALRAPRPLRVAVGLDVDDASHMLLAFLGRWKAQRALEFDCMHMHPANAGAMTIRDLTERVRQQVFEHLGANARLHLVPGDPQTALWPAAMMANPDLLVLGTHGRKGMDRLRHGSVAASVLRSGTHSLLIVPAATASAREALASPA